MGAHRALLRTEDVRIIKSMRNDVNRLVNAETANQQKTAEAAMRRSRRSTRSLPVRGLEQLPPALRELAELRLANPDVSLRELGELADPPLTKSAVYHRVAPHRGTGGGRAARTSGRRRPAERRDHASSRDTRA